MKHKSEGYTRRVFLQQVGMSGLALVIGSSLPAKGKEVGRPSGGDTIDVMGIELMS